MAKERPIIFNAESVRAILDGRKTMTRRVIKPQPPHWIWNHYKWDDRCIDVHMYDEGRTGYYVICQFGKPGDHLWVRENFWIEHDTDMTSYEGGTLVDCGVDLTEDKWAQVWYCSTDDEPDNTWFYSKHPSIHMPRWASRITLEITDVRVERLQDISEDDAEAEGIELIDHNCFRNYIPTKPDTIHFIEDPIGSFRSLWDSINARRVYSWDSNPWVWTISFRKT